MLAWFNLLGHRDGWFQQASVKINVSDCQGNLNMVSIKKPFLIEWLLQNIFLKNYLDPITFSFFLPFPNLSKWKLKVNRSVFSNGFR